MVTNITFLFYSGIHFCLIKQHSFLSFPLAADWQYVIEFIQERVLISAFISVFHIRQLIDSHVIELIQECDLERLEALVLQMYDHVIPPSNKLHIMSLVRQKCSKQLTELLKYIDCKQVSKKLALLSH